MATVLWEEEAVQATAGDEALTIPVPVTVLRVNGEIAFQPISAADYVIDAESITLRGSGGTPREFQLTFTLSTELVGEGYKFANPALKFFQGSSKKSGFRFSPESSVEATASLFNTKDSQDSKSEDSFNVLLVDPIQRLLVHDPTIVWDPPNG
ncbi:MAG TPA: hypothetical protein VEW48_14885 [Thermoanaerobaculia bacterium]|nr:hypothetical protein [Thermoanaerobaculia bacterium]